MAGRGVLSDVHLSGSLSDVRITVLNAAGGWTSPAKHPLHNDKPEKVGVGPGLAFAHGIIDFLPQGQCIGLVPCAYGGSAISRWGPDGDLYIAAVQRVREAEAAGGVLSGILWHQGESDANAETVTEYAERLRAVIRNFHAEFGPVPFILGEIGVHFLDTTVESLACAKGVNDIIVDVALTSGALVSVVSALGLDHRGDRLHFTAAAADDLGRRFAWKWLKMTGQAHVSLSVLVADTLDPPLLSNTKGQQCVN